VMDVPFAAAVDSPVQWVFDRTRISGMHARGDDGQYLAVSLSAADEYVNLTVAELRAMFVPALAELFPDARQAEVTEFFVTRERRATFRQVPGTAKLRPKSATELPGLVLAGSWTDTGWPDTMEGAVRSGLNAVIALHGAHGAAPSAPSAPGAPTAPAPPSSQRAESAFGHTLAGPNAQSARSGTEAVAGGEGPTAGTKDQISGFVPVREHEREVRS
jgi:Flavin containing amine oxidoreductase